MNCANHPDRERTAFCQNCGKPLCNECIRTVGSSIYCEPCFAVRTAGTGATYAPPPPPAIHAAPNPVLAGFLGLIPGVGAMYNEQYAKGIVHLIVFAILVSLSHDVDIFGLFVAGWIFYMAIEAHHTARARRDGTPLPNPFGLNDIGERLGFGRNWPQGGPMHSAYGAPPNPDPTSQPTGGQDPPRSAVPPYSYTYTPPVSQWGAPQQTYTPPPPPVAPVPPTAEELRGSYAHRFPSGAIWLIALGVIFLLGNLGVFHVIRVRYFGPFVLIGLGVWQFVHRMTSTGFGLENDGSDYYRYRFARAVRSSIWIVMTGVIWLLDVLRIIRWSHSWPLYLIAGGILMFFERAVPMGFAPPAGEPEPPQAAPGTAIVPTVPPPHDGEEGR